MLLPNIDGACHVTAHYCVNAGSRRPWCTIVFECAVRQGVPGGLVALHVLEEEAAKWLCGSVN